MLYNTETLKQKLNSLNYKYKMAIWTYKADFTEVVDDIENLLEIRAFDENGEFRAYRSMLNSDFKVREIVDDEAYGDGYIDEKHYLDIDTTKCSVGDSLKVATGGGAYHLPEMVADSQLLKVRYFYKYDSDGIARKFDWRIIGFCKEGQV